MQKYLHSVHRIVAAQQFYAAICRLARNPKTTTSSSPNQIGHDNDPLVLRGFLSLADGHLPVTISHHLFPTPVREIPHRAHQHPRGGWAVLRTRPKERHHPAAKNPDPRLLKPKKSRPCALSGNLMTMAVSL